MTYSGFTLWQLHALVNSSTPGNSPGDGIYEYNTYFLHCNVTTHHHKQIIHSSTSRKDANFNVILRGKIVIGNKPHIEYGI